MREDDIQIAVFDHIRRRRLPGVFAFHPKNGGPHQQSPGQRIQNARKGVVSGVPDVVALQDGRVYGLEIKTDVGVVSIDQESTLAAMQTAGATVAVVYGLDQAIRKLEEWGLLRGQADVRGVA